LKPTDDLIRPIDLGEGDFSKRVQRPEPSSNAKEKESGKA
jgi:hypothetical protein